MRVSSSIGIVLVGLLLTACEETTTSTTVSLPLCDPAVKSLAPLDPAEPPSTDGGTLVLVGKHFWGFSSTAEVPLTVPSDSPTPTPDPEATPTATPAPPAELEFNTQVMALRVGDQPAHILSAVERVVQPYVLIQDVEGAYQYLGCSACSTCLTANPYSCGACDTACLGCEQVVTFELPKLDASAGQLDAESLRVNVVFFGETGQTPAVSFDLPLACGDGIDNDLDGLADLDDLDCQTSAWSELAP